MSKTAVITARLDPETLASFDGVAARQDRSRAWLLSKVISDYVAEERAFQAFLQEAEDQIDRGESYTRDQMDAWFDERRARRAE